MNLTQGAMFNGLEKITEEKLFIYVLFFCSLIVPGFLAIFFYFPNLFYTSDPFRLAILSLSFSLPIFLFGCLIAIKFVSKRNLATVSIVLVSASIFSLVSFFLSLLIVKLTEQVISIDYPLLITYLLCIVIIYYEPKMMLAALKVKTA